MPTFGFNKIVRGKLPEMYEELNQKTVSRRLVGRELLLQLRNKIVEEVQEIPIDSDELDIAKITREISDVKQGLKDLQELLGITDEDVEAARLEKFNEKGGFLDGIFIELIELEDDDKWVDYYRKEPGKYPEQGRPLPIIKPGIYVHYKSEKMRYYVEGVGRNTETGEEYVIYKALYEADEKPDFWARPIDMFVSNVEVDSQVVPRFRRLDG